MTALPDSGGFGAGSLPAQQQCGTDEHCGDGEAQPSGPARHIVQAVMEIEHRGHRFAQPRDGDAICHAPTYSSRSFGAPLKTGRTSIGMLPGLPPGPGAAEARAAIR